MPLRLAFDLDGVLADMESELDRRAVELFGERPGVDLAADPGADETPAGIEEGLPGTATAVEAALETTPPALKQRLSPRQVRRLWRHVEGIEDFWESLPEVEPGTVARLAQLAGDRRWEMIFLTK